MRRGLSTASPLSPFHDPNQHETNHPHPRQPVHIGRAVPPADTAPAGLAYPARNTTTTTMSSPLTSTSTAAAVSESSTPRSWSHRPSADSSLEWSSVRRENPTTTTTSLEPKWCASPAVSNDVLLPAILQHLCEERSPTAAAAASLTRQCSQQRWRSAFEVWRKVLNSDALLLTLLLHAGCLWSPDYEPLYGEWQRRLTTAAGKNGSPTCFTAEAHAERVDEELPQRSVWGLHPEGATSASKRGSKRGFKTCGGVPHELEGVWESVMRSLYKDFPYDMWAVATLHFLHLVEVFEVESAAPAASPTSSTEGNVTTREGYPRLPVKTLGKRRRSFSVGSPIGAASSLPLSRRLGGYDRLSSRAASDHNAIGIHRSTAEATEPVKERRFHASCDFLFPAALRHWEGDWRAKTRASMASTDPHGTIRVPASSALNSGHVSNLHPLPPQDHAVVDSESFYHADWWSCTMGHHDADKVRRVAHQLLQEWMRLMDSIGSPRDPLTSPPPAGSSPPIDARDVWFAAAIKLAAYVDDVEAPLVEENPHVSGVAREEGRDWTTLRELLHTALPSIFLCLLQQEAVCAHRKEGCHLPPQQSSTANPSGDPKVGTTMPLRGQAGVFGVAQGVALPPVSLLVPFHLIGKGTTLSVIPLSGSRTAISTNDLQERDRSAAAGRHHPPVSHRSPPSPASSAAVSPIRLVGVPQHYAAHHTASMASPSSLLSPAVSSLPPHSQNDGPEDAGSQARLAKDTIRAMWWRGSTVRSHGVVVRHGALQLQLDVPPQVSTADEGKQEWYYLGDPRAFLQWGCAAGGPGSAREKRNCSAPTPAPRRRGRRPRYVTPAEQTAVASPAAEPSGGWSSRVLLLQPIPRRQIESERPSSTALVYPYVLLTPSPSMAMTTPTHRLDEALQWFRQCFEVEVEQPGGGAALPSPQATSSAGGVGSSHTTIARAPPSITATGLSRSGGGTAGKRGSTMPARTAAQPLTANRINGGSGGSVASASVLPRDPMLHYLQSLFRMARRILACRDPHSPSPSTTNAPADHVTKPLHAPSHAAGSGCTAICWTSFSHPVEEWLAVASTAHSFALLTLLLFTTGHCMDTQPTSNTPRTKSDSECREGAVTEGYEGPHTLWLTQMIAFLADLSLLLPYPPALPTSPPPPTPFLSPSGLPALSASDSHTSICVSVVRGLLYAMALHPRPSEVALVAVGWCACLVQRSKRPPSKSSSLRNPLERGTTAHRHTAPTSSTPPTSGKKLGVNCPMIEAPAAQATIIDDASHVFLWLQRIFSTSVLPFSISCDEGHTPKTPAEMYTALWLPRCLPTVVLVLLRKAFEECFPSATTAPAPHTPPSSSSLCTDRTRGAAQSTEEPPPRIPLPAPRFWTSSNSRPGEERFRACWRYAYVCTPRKRNVHPPVTGVSSGTEGNADEGEVPYVCGPAVCRFQYFPPEFVSDVPRLESAAWKRGLLLHKKRLQGEREKNRCSLGREGTPTGHSSDRKK